MTKAERIEQCILRTGKAFNSRPKNFRVEEDLRCKMVAYLYDEFPRKGCMHEAVRAGFPALKRRGNGHYDVVLMTKESSAEFAKCYGRDDEPIYDFTRDLKHWAIIELKQITERTGKASSIQSDIGNLKMALSRGRAHRAYMVIFSHEPTDIEDDAYEDIVKRYRRATRLSPRLEIFRFSTYLGEDKCVIHIKNGKICS